MNVLKQSQNLRDCPDTWSSFVKPPRFNIRAWLSREQNCISAIAVQHLYGVSLSDTGVSMLPLILLLIGCLIAFGVTVLSVMLMMYRRRGTTSPVHIEPYMKQPIITPPDSRNNSMLDVTHGDHTYFVEYTLKQVTDYALNNQPDIIQSPQGNTVA